MYFIISKWQKIIFTINMDMLVCLNIKLEVRNMLRCHFIISLKMEYFLEIDRHAKTCTFVNEFGTNYVHVHVAKCLKCWYYYSVPR